MATGANIAMVPLEGSLDVTTVPAARRVLDALVEGGCRRVVVNMAEVDHVDSAGLGLILAEWRRLRELGGLLSLANVGPMPYRALCRMRMADYIPISRAGQERAVSELPAGALPLWRTTFRVEPEGLPAARERTEGLLARLPLTEDQLFDLTLTVGEAVGNAVDHTCGGGVLVMVEAFADRVSVDVTDCGEGFGLAADEEVPEVGEFAERGRGIRLMRLLADSVSIAPKRVGTGTVVHLVKLFSAKI